MKSGDRVFLLLHQYPLGEGNVDEKLLGIYSTREAAARRARSAALLPGFKEAPDAFLVDEITVDQDQWREGFKFLD